MKEKAAAGRYSDMPAGLLFFYHFLNKKLPGGCGQLRCPVPAAAVSCFGRTDKNYAFFSRRGGDINFFLVNLHTGIRERLKRDGVFDEKITKNKI